MRMFAVFLLAVATVAGAWILADEPREASAKAQVIGGPGCAIFGHPPSAAGAPGGDFATNIVTSELAEYISVLEPTDPAFGGQDAYYASARLLPFWWSQPQNAGPNVNTAANETRASLSEDTERFYVGRGDIYVSERQ